MTDKPQTLAEQIRAKEGPQYRVLKTCKGCCHFKSEYWREPSGDGETYDSGTSADCLKAGRNICSYYGDEPSPPDWCPCAALEPDPTPALSWRAMQTAAVKAVAKEAHGETVLGGQRFKTVKLEDAVDAILALPGPTADQLLADAVRLPEVQAVVKCLDREKSLIWIIENTVQVLIRDLALEMLGQQRAALKAWRDGQRPPTEYEQKLAALKKDFPNGI